MRLPLPLRWPRWSASHAQSAVNAAVVAIAASAAVVVAGRVLLVGRAALVALGAARVALAAHAGNQMTRVKRAVAGSPRAARLER